MKTIKYYEFSLFARIQLKLSRFKGIVAQELHKLRHKRQEKIFNFSENLKDWAHRMLELDAMVDFDDISIEETIEIHESKFQKIVKVMKKSTKRKAIRLIKVLLRGIVLPLIEWLERISQEKDRKQTERATNFEENRFKPR
jgi:hypothetical protein